MRKTFQALVLAAAAMLLGGCKQEAPRRAGITSETEVTKLVEQYKIRKIWQGSQVNSINAYITKKGQDNEIDAFYVFNEYYGDSLILSIKNKERSMNDSDEDGIIDSFCLEDTCFYWDEEEGWIKMQGKYAGDPNEKAAEMQRLFDTYRQLLGVDKLRARRYDYSNGMF